MQEDLPARKHGLASGGDACRTVQTRRETTRQNMYTHINALPAPRAATNSGEKKGAILAPQMHGIRVPNLTESYGIVRNRTESEPTSFFGRAFSHAFLLNGLRNQRNHLNSL